MPPGDPAALANALGELLASPEARRRLGEAGRARARRDYARDTVLARLAALYGERRDR